MIRLFIRSCFLLTAVTGLHAGEGQHYSARNHMYDAGISQEIHGLAKGNLNVDITRIPLKRAGNLFLAEAVIDSVRGNFIVDLGAPYLVLNSTYFRDYKVDHTSFSQGLATGTDYVKWVKVGHLYISDLEYTGLVADVVDLGAIENKRGIKILGLLGVSLFDEFVLELDLKGQQLVIHKSASTFTAGGEKLFDVPIKLRNDVITIKAEVNGVMLNFSLDSAAEANILHNDLPPEVYKEMRILNTSLLRDANGGSTEVLTAVIGGIVVAGRKMDEMQTLILNMNTMREAYERNIQGMFGYPFLASGTALINFKTSSLTMYTNNRLINE